MKVSTGITGPQPAAVTYVCIEHIDVPFVVGTKKDIMYFSAANIWLQYYPGYRLFHYNISMRSQYFYRMWSIDLICLARHTYTSTEKYIENFKSPGSCFSIIFKNSKGQ